MERQVHATPDKQVSLTDPDARAMATSGRGTGMVGYNVQTAVDAEHHLIVAHEVTNLGHDRTQLEPMALKARDATGCEEITALADRGYFNGEQVLACEGTGILPCVARRSGWESHPDCRAAPVCSQDGHIERNQAGLLYPARLHLRRPGRSLCLPRRRPVDQEQSSPRSQRRVRRVSSSLGLLHLRPETQVRPGQASTHQALETGRRDGQDAGQARPHARRHGCSPPDRRTPVRNPQILDGKAPTS